MHPLPRRQVVGKCLVTMSSRKNHRRIHRSRVISPSYIHTICRPIARFYSHMRMDKLRRVETATDFGPGVDELNLMDGFTES